MSTAQFSRFFPTTPVPCPSLRSLALVLFPHSLALVPSALLSCNYDVVAISSMSAIAASPSRSLTLTLHECVFLCVCMCVCVWCSSSVVFAWKIVCASRSAHLKSASLAAGSVRGNGVRGSLRLWRSLVWLLGKLFWFSIRWPTTQLEPRAQTK